MFTYQNWNGFNVFCDDISHEIYMTVTELARVLKKQSVTIGNIARRKYATRLEVVNGLSLIGHNQVRLIPADGILDLLEKYQSAKLLDFVSALEQYEAFIQD